MEIPTTFGTSIFHDRYDMQILNNPGVIRSNHLHDNEEKVTGNEIESDVEDNV